MRTHIYLSSISTLIICVALTGCNPEAETVVEGSCATVYGGEICTYGVISGSAVVEFGATVSLSTVENAPLDEIPVFPPINLARVAFPDEVRSASGVDHLGINWEVQGHPPETFQTPHFDFHFYMTDGTTVDGIDCSDTSKPDVVPAGYELHDMPIPGTDMMLVGTCVPQMGMHAVNAEHAARSEKFDATMIVGYYASEPIFVEPMITRDLLLRRENFTLDMPAGVAGINVPAAFEGTYEADTDSYRLQFRM